MKLLNTVVDVILIAILTTALYAGFYQDHICLTGSPRFFGQLYYC